MTEFEIRRKMEAIRLSEATPIAKARELLRLRRMLSQQICELEKAKAQVARTGDRSTRAMLTRMATNAEFLEDDVRETARNTLSGRRFSGIHSP
jgi:hypothetical protein